jgi:hypothetical protein
MKKLVFSLLVLIAGTVFSYAAEIDGKWKGTFGAPGGGEGMELTFTFKADGEKLTGSITTQMGDMQFTNGKISGKEFSFDVDMQGMVIKHKGTIDGDTIKMKVEGFGAPEGGDGGPAQEPMILKRVKQ